ncbi:MAG: hypothetical protein ACOVO2_25360 [Emticicia sp.]|uniref:hypothetical protein n=1 Tax=Emticicia sp. TaxID=1930953 RepID=UPI003BA4C3DA
MKNILPFFLLFVFISCSKFERISKRIDTYNKARKPFITAHQMRVKLYKKGYLGFINLMNDTLIISQSGQIDALIYGGIIAGTKEKICYEYNDYDKKLEINKYGCELHSLIQKWDTLGIRAKELEQKNLIRSKVYYKRIILNNNKIVKKDAIEFMEIID